MVLTERARKALWFAMDLTGCNKTDLVNRYAQMGAYIEWRESQGVRYFEQEPGSEEKVPYRFTSSLPLGEMGAPGPGQPATLRLHETGTPPGKPPVLMLGHLPDS